MVILLKKPSGPEAWLLWQKTAAKKILIWLSSFSVLRRSEACRHFWDLQKLIITLSNGAIWIWNVNFLIKNADPYARNPFKSNGNLQKSIVEHPPPLPTCPLLPSTCAPQHVGIGGGGFTTDFCRLPMDLGGFLAWGVACISLLVTRHVQKTSTSEPFLSFSASSLPLLRPLCLPFTPVCTLYCIVEAIGPFSASLDLGHMGHSWSLLDARWSLPSSRSPDFDVRFWGPSPQMFHPN